MGLIISHLRWEERRQHSYINFAWPVKCHSLFWFAAVIVSFLFQTPHCQQNVPQDAKKPDLHICIRIGKSIVLSKTPCMIKMVLRIQVPGSCKKEDGRSKITVGHHRGTARGHCNVQTVTCQQHLQTEIFRSWAKPLVVLLGDMYKLRCCICTVRK